MAKRQTDILTDHEALLLSEVRRQQPVTAYRLIKSYGIDSASVANSSKGHVYPMIRKLAQRRLLLSKAVPGDARGTETWECTEEGLKALREWLRTTQSTHLLLEDPFRTKMMSFDILNREEQLEWIFDAKNALKEKLGELEQASNLINIPSTPYIKLAHDNAFSSIRSRMDWLDRILFIIMENGPSRDSR